MPEVALRLELSARAASCRVATRPPVKSTGQELTPEANLVWVGRQCPVSSSTPFVFCLSEHPGTARATGLDKASNSFGNDGSRESNVGGNVLRIPIHRRTNPKGQQLCGYRGIELAKKKEAVA